MATHKPADKGDGNLMKKLKENWASELCAEHEGSIGDFSKLDSQLSSLEDYEILFDRSKWNLAKAGKIAGGIVAGVAVFGPLAYVAAPVIASAAAGTAGLLGTASTGTAIGAALTTSLAAIGPGGMAGSVAFITATGAGLGAKHGAVVSNSYFGNVKDFKITKVKEGRGPALIFINGFLSQKNQDCSDWIRSVRVRFPDNPYYYVNWESGSLYELGRLIGEGAGGVGFQEIIKKLMKTGSKKFSKKRHPLEWTSVIADLLGNPWHTSMVKASMTGILLADLLSRTNQKDGFILMGNSLGARVIYYLLNAISTKDQAIIRDVYLLGGAVDKKDKEGWQTGLKAVNGNLYNCYSHNDHTLKFLYRGANALFSSPIGLGDIEVSDPRLINIDTSSIVSAHMEYKEKFGDILSQIYT